MNSRNYLCNFPSSQLSSSEEELFFILQSCDRRPGGWWVDRKGRGGWVFLFRERGQGFIPCLEISQINLERPVYLPWETGGCRVWRGMRDLSYLFWISDALSERVLSHFSVLLYEAHFPWGEHHFLWRTVNLGGVSHWSLQGNTHSFANWQTESPTK